MKKSKMAFVKDAEDHQPELAIVGMACHYPGCDTLTEYWEMLMNRDVKIQRIDVPGRSTPVYGAFTSAIEKFDSEFFGIPLWELKTVDPQQTLSVTTAYESLLNAGLDKDLLSNQSVGVFVGVCSNDARVVTQDSPNNPLATGFTPSLIANRISHLFGFTGPSMTIDTSCASSLSALYVACYSLLNHDCAIALVGGVNGLFHPSMFNVYEGMGMLSPIGESRVFDKSASGFVRGEGCGFVVLRLVEDHSEPVLAVIRSVGTNHNGSLTNRIVVPSSDAQEALLQTVLRKAGLQPKDISYIEAHGTGTKAGDRSEIESIGKVFGSCQCHQPVVVGSVKANIGHLEGGAGLAGLIKAVLVVNNGVAPGNAGLDKLSLDVGESLAISKSMLPLFPPSGLPATLDGGFAAVVNSFGFGGVNVAAVIQAPFNSSVSTVTETPSPLSPTLLPEFYERFELRKYIRFFEMSCTTPADEVSSGDSCDLFADVESGYASAVNSPKKHRQHFGKDKLCAGELAQKIEGVFRDSMKSDISRSIYEEVLCDIDLEDDVDHELTFEQLACKNVFSLGLDSISLVQLSAFIKKAYGVVFTYSDLIELETIENIAEKLVVDNLRCP